MFHISSDDNVLIVSYVVVLEQFTGTNLTGSSEKIEGFFLSFDEHIFYEIVIANVAIYQKNNKSAMIFLLYRQTYPSVFYFFSYLKYSMFYLLTYVKF